MVAEPRITIATASRLVGGAHWPRKQPSLSVISFSKSSALIITHFKSNDDYSSNLPVLKVKSCAAGRRRMTITIQPRMIRGGRMARMAMPMAESYDSVSAKKRPQRQLNTLPGVLALIKVMGTIYLVSGLQRDSGCLGGRHRPRGKVSGRNRPRGEVSGRHRPRGEVSGRPAGSA